MFKQVVAEIAEFIAAKILDKAEKQVAAYYPEKTSRYLSRAYKAASLADNIMQRFDEQIPAELPSKSNRIKLETVFRTKFTQIRNNHFKMNEEIAVESYNVERLQEALSDILGLPVASIYLSPVQVEIKLPEAELTLPGINGTRTGRSAVKLEQIQNIYELNILVPPSKQKSFAVYTEGTANGKRLEPEIMDKVEIYKLTAKITRVIMATSPGIKIDSYVDGIRVHITHTTEAHKEEEPREKQSFTRFIRRPEDLKKDGSNHR